MKYQLENPPVLTRKQAIAGHYNPRAFFETETYCVWNTANKCPVQSDFSSEVAERSCGILNDHETRNGRPAVYRWFKFAV